MGLSSILRKKTSVLILSPMMIQSNYILFLLVSLLFVAIESNNVRKANTEEQDTFIAAVYEHLPILALPVCYQEVCNRDDALASVVANLQMYSEQTKEAKNLGAKIIVFPEFGITPWVPRNQVIPFSENIPDLDQSGPEWIPCDEENEDGSLTAQQRLSCMAKENQIYVVANMVDYKECDECGENFCLYNTNVMYDTEGKYVARYHKYNLFNSEFSLFNIDKKEQNIFVDTDFGRLGLIICEDLLWYFPTVDLVSTNNVDTIIFPTEWWDEYPHQLPHVDQASWAKALQINWLGSNYHNPSAANSGSGIFTTEGTVNYYHNVSASSKGKLVVAEVPVHTNKLTTQVSWSKYVEENASKFQVGVTEFESLIYGDVFTLVEMDPEQNEVKVCGEGDEPLCCVASYEYSQTESDGIFSLGMFSGIHYRDGSVRESMGFGICTVLKCNSKTSNMCDSHDYLHSGISQTYFSKLELSGNFNSETSVFPQSVFTELQLLPELEKVLPDGRIILNLDGDDNQENTPLISMSLFGRKFGDDGPAPEQWCPHGEFPPDSSKRCYNGNCKIPK